MRVHISLRNPAWRYLFQMLIQIQYPHLLGNQYLGNPISLLDNPNGYEDLPYIQAKLCSSLLDI